MRARLLLAIVSVLIPSVTRAAWQPDGVAISASANYQTTQAIISDGAGGAIITWHDFRSGTSYDVFVQRVDASGNVLWTANGVPVSTGVGDQAIPALITDGAGGAIITWYDDRTFNFSSDIYAQRVDASGNVLWTTNGVAICTASKSQITPQIVSDGAGGAIIAWEDGRVSGTNRDVYAQRINGAGSVQWAVNGVALCAAANNQYLPKLVSDGSGGAIATWVDFRLGGVSDIFAQRVSAAGTVAWPANGVAISAAGGSQYNPLIAADGTGGAIVTWQDFRSGLADVYAQRVNAAGAPQWTVDGVAISTTGWEAPAQIVSDGAGGAIVTWHMLEDDGFEFDLYAQRVSASGTVQWSPSGVAISTADGNQTASSMVSDGDGGALITWEDSLYASNSNYDIRAQRIDPTGTKAWAPGGVPVCGATNEQRRPVIIMDGPDGAIVAWEDFRNGANMDIFALKIDAATASGVGDTPRASTLTLRSNYPNPFASQTTFLLDLSDDADIAVDVFDVAGRRVRHEELGRLKAGPRSIAFDGAADDGRSLASGVYFYRLNANGASVTRKVVIAR